MKCRRFPWKPALTGVLLVLTMCRAWASDVPVHPRQAGLQLFVFTSQTTVAVGEPFLLTAEIYLWAGSPHLLDEVKQAFDEAPLDPADAATELVRSDTIAQKYTEVDGMPFVRLSRQYVLRTWKEGDVRAPVLRLRIRGFTYEGLAEPIRSFRVNAGFFKASESIVSLIAHTGARSRLGSRTGTAFVAGPDALVTNFHVVMEADRVVIMLPNGSRFSTRRAWVLDPARDIAILYVPARVLREAGLKPLALASSAGEDIAFTNSWSKGQQRSTAGRIYRNLHFLPGENILISANPVRPGNSGGPLLTRNGAVLGVVSAGTVDRGIEALREDVSISTDPRPALLRKSRMRAPRLLSTWMRDRSVRQAPQTLTLWLSSLLRRGRYALDVRPDWEERLDAFIAEHPDDARLHYLRAQLFEMKGTYQAAEDAYEHAMNASSDYFPATYSLGLRHLVGGNYVAAEQLFDEALVGSPYTHLAVYGLALAHLAQRRFDEAIVELQRVVQHDPSFAPGIFDLATCYLAVGDEQRARGLVLKLEELHAFQAAQLRQMLRFPVLRPIPRFEIELARTALD